MSRDTDAPYCAGRSCALEVARGLQVLAGRWSVAVVEALHFAGEPLRFTQLRRAAGPISQKELARHLARLLEAGVVRRCQGEGRTQAYALTTRGRSLLPVMQAIGEWGAASLAPAGQARATWLGPLGALAAQDPEAG